MPSRPVRYPQGVSTFPPKHVLSTYPSVPTNTQVVIEEDFLPYSAGNYALTTAVAGTVAAFSTLAGAVKMATSANAGDTMFIARGGSGFQMTLQNQLWCDTRLSYPRTVLNANDTNIYWGLFDTVSPLTAANGIYFVKPAGGTAVHFVIKKAGVATTFQNIGDISLPSGLYNDANSVNATLSATIAGGAFSALAVATPGAGYEWQPLILSTATSGVAGNAVATTLLGSTANTQSNPAVPVQSTGLPYASVAGVTLTNPGSGYTNQGPVTTVVEVEAMLNYQFWYNGKDSLYVGVNGRIVMSIVGGVGTSGGPGGNIGVVGVAPGTTVNVATSISPSFYSTTQLSASVASPQPPVGNPINMVPLIPMNYAVGLANTTANIRTLYVDEFNVGVEIN